MTDVWQYLVNGMKTGPEANLLRAGVLIRYARLLILGTYNRVIRWKKLKF